MRAWGELLRCERDHPVRGVDPYHRAARQTPSDLAAHLAVTAAEAEDPLVTGERQAGEALLGQPLLKRRNPVVRLCVPLGHVPFLSSRGRRHKTLVSRWFAVSRSARPEPDADLEALRPRTMNGSVEQYTEVDVALPACASRRVAAEVLTA